MTTPLPAWREAVDARIVQTLERTVAATAPAGPGVAEITDPMLASARGGKRLRALLLLASHAAHRGDDVDAATDAATALELFQTAALVHDDVLDDSDTRRGLPSVHRAIASIHAERAWSGDSRAYGDAGAVLAGDLALMACQRALGQAVARLGHDRGERVSTLFSDMAELVTAGQYADMRAAAQPLGAIAGQRDEILAVMRSKTASYTCEFPLALGAAAAGGDDQAISRVRAIGVDLGIAFQLRDDLLGLLGSPEVTGKPAGDDVREGKRTFVLWRAWTETDDTGRARIGAVLGDKDASDDAVADVAGIVAATDAERWCEEQIDERSRTALRRLDEASLDPGATGTLRELIAKAVSRTS
ncbi:polyprenyl synthetase family protein [Demequina sp. NBRC 110056]|uniref:polyprenyl synthetase family protein n=1 Tax=Demequina sp. NBRC 110056 TaxID=1570345 RepID=UPI0013563397|nr:polyprenyl synthetase family protein [Demequina sp. NBRC 110056]